MSGPVMGAHRFDAERLAQIASKVNGKRVFAGSALPAWLACPARRLQSTAGLLAALVGWLKGDRDRNQQMELRAIANPANALLRATKGSCQCSQTHCQYSAQ
jgi:hypothetical protein